MVGSSLRATHSVSSIKRSVALLAVLLVSFLGLPTQIAQAYSVPPGTESKFVNTTFEGCRNDGTITLPIGGKFVCPDAAYTTGNLGKGWNELDLVPHRLTTSLGTQSDATTDYNVSVMADGITTGVKGYDVVSVPVVNAAKSDASCTVSAGPQSLQGDAGTPFGGGTDTVIYRDLTIHQNKGTTCVFDYYERLALGSHLYPGSSLQSYLGVAPDLGGSKKTVSIPVNQILPQSLSKDMTATQGSSHVWNITKSATPVSLNIPNTCDTTPDARKASVGITISWEKLPAVAGGPITVLTHVYANNPSARVITTTVSDDIRSGTTVLDTAGPVTKDVPANTANYLMLTHTTQVPAGTTNLNDVATGTYTDLVTGVPIPGTTTATASATVQMNGPVTNQTAVISDVESITGSGLTFSVDSTTGASGTFGGGYILGTPTTGPVNWTSASQSDSGSVTFNKTVYAAKGTITSNGNLHDAATLNASDGFTANASLDVAINVDTKATLTIDKTIPDILQGAETASFTFHVKNAQNVEVATRVLTFAAGETSKSASVADLPPGIYTVSEDPATGWDPQSDVVVDLRGDICVGTATFNNDYIPASATARKVSVPAGFEGNWEFTLSGTTPSGPITPEKVTTSGSGAKDFATKLGEGTYTITETTQPGWSSDGGSAACSFTVNLPADAGKAYNCVFTNTYNPSITLSKTGSSLSKITDPVTYDFTLKNTSPTPGAAGAPSLVCTIDDPTASFSRTVTLAPGATDVSSKTINVPLGASDPFPNTATATCHYPGLTPVVASASSSHNVNLFQPSVKITKTGPATAKVGDTVTYNVKIDNTSSADSPNLVLDSFSDSLVPGAAAPAACNNLASGTSCSFSYTYTVKAGDPDPLVNTATVHYHPAGFTNDIHDASSWTVDLFQPGIRITKTGPAISKATDPVTYTIKIENTSSAGAPNLVLDSFSDSLVPGAAAPAACNNLASGDSCTFTYDYTVKVTDPDPLVNVATVHYHSVGSANDVTDSSSASVNLFQPGVKITKTGPASAKIGDVVTYNVKIDNTSSADAPNLALDSFSDSLVPGATPPAACNNLGSGASCSFSYNYTVKAGDPDPLNNTATVHYHPAGFPNDIHDASTWTVNLFQPSVKITKTGPPLSKATDDVTYTIKIENTSSADSPNLVLDSFSDSLVAGVTPPAACNNLASGASCTFTYDYTVKAGDPDPLVNKATVHYHSAGVANDVTDNSSWTVNLFQPGVKITKTGPASAKIGDVVTYNVKIDNTSSADAPNLVLDSFSDSLVPGATPPAACGNLASSTSCSFSYTYTVQAGDPDPLVNTATVHYHPAGFPNDIHDASSWTVNLFQPSVKITKTGPPLSKATDGVTYNITIANTSSADAPNLVLDSFSDSLVPGVTPPAACNNLASGASCSFSYAYTVKVTDPDPLVNTATVHYHSVGVANDVTDSSTATINLFQPSVKITKTGPATAKAGDTVTYNVVIDNTSSADAPNLVLDSFSDSLVPAATAPGACNTLASGASCSFSYTYTVKAGDPDPLNNTATVHYHPAGFPNDIHDSSTWTVDLFQPGIMITKTGPAISKATDPVTYTIKIENTSSVGSPDLVLDSFSDSLVPGVTAPQACNTLASGASCTFTYDYTVKVTDPDPLVNTATVHYHSLGSANDVTDTSAATVNLFQPSVKVTKTGPATAKVGDTVTYNVKIDNTSSADAPDLLLDSFGDSLVPGATPPVDCNDLASGKGCSFTYTYTVGAGDPDPLVNKATVHYHPAGFPNDIHDDSTWTVDLFQPGVKITKTGPALSKATDDATYHITIENTSSAGAPNLVLDSFSDSLVPGVTPPAECNNLASGASCSFSYDYTVTANDPDPLVNTATVHYHSVGVANDVTDSSTATVNLFQPGVKITKTADKSQVIPDRGEVVTYTVKIDNTSSADAPNLVLDSFSDSLVPTVTPPAECNNLASGASCSFSYTYTTQNGDFALGATVVNTATVHYHPARFPNDIHDASTWTVEAGEPPQAQHVWELKSVMPHRVQSGGFETLDTAVVKGRLSRHCGYMVAKFWADGDLVAKTKIKTNYRTLVKLFLDGKLLQSKIGQAHNCPSARAPSTEVAPTPEPTPSPTPTPTDASLPASTVSPSPGDPSKQ